MGLKGDAAIVGFAQYRPEKYATAPRMMHLDQVAELTALALQDAGLAASDIDGLAVHGPLFHEAAMFVPAMCCEHLGLRLNFAEVLDLGGCTSVAMIARAAMAIESGLCQAVICVIPSRLAPMGPGDDPVGIFKTSRYGGHSTVFGAPEAEFDIPYGHVGQNTGYAMIAQRYAAKYGYDPLAMAKIAADQRASAQVNPEAAFFGKPITCEDVLTSKMVADPLHVLEIVMPMAGGAAVIVANKNVAKRCKHRAAKIVGYGERLEYKSPTYSKDMTVTPIEVAAQNAFGMAGLSCKDIDAAQIYDCYTITVLLSLEGAGFCAKGTGMKFVRDHDLSWRGEFPVNTHGGQLSFGQSGTAGGMSQVIEGVIQIMGRAGERQLSRCDTVFVSGTGGVMSEQGVIILQGV